MTAILLPDRSIAQPALPSLVDPLTLDPLNDKLVFSWRAKPNLMAGGTIYDESVHKRTGTLTNGPTWVADGLSFDGSDDFVNCGTAIPTYFNGRSQITLTARFTPGLATGGSEPHILNIESGSFDIAIGIKDAGTPSIQGITVSISSSGGGTAGTRVFDKSDWVARPYTITMTWNNGTTVTYLDGVQVDSRTIGSGTFNLGGSDELWLGKADSQNFGGILHGAWIHSVALSPAQVNALYLNSQNGHNQTERRHTSRYWTVGAGGGSSGTAAQTLPSLSQSAAGAVSAQGTAAQQLPSLSQAATSSSASTGTAAQTLPSLSQSASGQVAASAAASQTLPSLSQTAAGGVQASATASQSLPRLTQTLTGQAIAGGDGASLLPSLTQGATGETDNTIDGAASQVLPALGKYWQDDHASVGSVLLTGVNASNSDSGVLYGLLDEVLEGVYNITLFSDVGISTAVAEGVRSGFGPMTITPVGGSGINGSIDVLSYSTTTLFSTWPWHATGSVLAGGDGASLLPSIGQSGIAKVLVTGTGSQTLPGVRQAAVGGGPLVRVCLRISDQARYSLAIADGARYRVAVSDQARNAVALTDAARYALQTTDSARYDLATSDETC